MKDSILNPGLIAVRVACLVGNGLERGRQWCGSPCARLGSQRIAAGKSNDAREALQCEHSGERKQQPGRDQPAGKRRAQTTPAIENAFVTL